MVELVWQKWFEIGHEAIDFEHKTFFDLIHKAQGLADSDAPADEIRRVLEEVLKYADFHFTNEENLMIEGGYGPLENHRRIHKALLSNLGQHISLYDGGADKAQEIVAFLFHWLLEHTVTEDMNISKAIKERMLRSYFREAERGKTP